MGPSSDATRRRLLDSARHRFVRLGYGGATTRGIAEDAGVFPANLRHHLGSKPQVFDAVYEDCLRVVRDAFAVRGPLDGRPVGSPGDRFRAVAAAVLAEPEVAAFLAIAPLERARHRELAGPTGDIPRDLEAAVRDEVRAGVARGELGGDPDPDALADALVGATYGLLVQLTVVDPSLDPRRVVDAFARLVDGTRWPQVDRRG